MRYTLRLSYDGSAFSGWQIQDNARSVQEELTKAIRTLTGQEITVTGAGRTDTGVNAVNYVAHFDLEGLLPFGTDEFAYKISAILPHEIVVHEVAEAAADFHSRFGATKRTYKYFIHRGKDPFADRFSWQCRYALDMEKMNLACRHLLGKHDFSCFEKTGGGNATSICTIFEAQWRRYTPTHIGQLGYPDGDYIVFTVSADRFLRNMVRAIVGTLVEIGRGRQEPEWMREVMASGDRCRAGESVPGKSLFLCSVEY